MRHESIENSRLTSTGLASGLLIRLLIFKERAQEALGSERHARKGVDSIYPLAVVVGVVGIGAII